MRIAADAPGVDGVVGVGVVVGGRERLRERHPKREREPPKDDQDDGKCYGTAALREGMPGSCGLKTKNIKTNL